MQNEQLRPCMVKVSEIIETYQSHPDREKKIRVAKEAETKKGYFHTWGVEAYTTNGYLVGTVPGQVSMLYGLVEYEDGTLHKIDPERVIFTDRDCEE